MLFRSQRREDGRKCPAFVMVKQSRNIFEQQIRRAFGLSQSGNLKEESSSGVGKSPAEASVRKRLAGKSTAEQVEVGQVCGDNFSCVWIISFLLLDVMDGAVTGVGVLVDLAVPHALEAARAGQPRTESADPGEHIKISNQVVSSPSS